MVKDQIAVINDISEKVASGNPYLLSFNYIQKSNSEILNKSEFYINNRNIFYNSQLKIFDRLFLKFLQGYSELNLTPTNHEPVKETLSIDFFHLIWNSIKKLSEYEVGSLFITHNDLIVSRNKQKNSLLHLPYHDQSDNIVFYYFFYKPKTIQSFLEEYEFESQVNFFRSLLSLAILDYIKFSTPNTPSTAYSDPLLELNTPLLEDKKVSDSSLKKISGLKRILSAIKKNL